MFPKTIGSKIFGSATVGPTFHQKDLRAVMFPFHTKAPLVRNRLKMC